MPNQRTSPTSSRGSLVPSSPSSPEYPNSTPSPYPDQPVEFLQQHPAGDFHRSYNAPSNAHSITPSEERVLCDRYTGPSLLLKSLVGSSKPAKEDLDFLRERCYLLDPATATRAAAETPHLQHYEGQPQDNRQDQPLSPLTLTPRKVACVFIAVEPNVKTNWFSRYMSWMEEVVFDHLRSAHLYPIVLWEDGTATKYNSFVRNKLVAASSTRLGGPSEPSPMADNPGKTPFPISASPISSPTSPNLPVDVYDFCKTYTTENPSISLVSVGKTVLAPKDAEAFLVAWVQARKKGTEKNRRAFVDRFLNFMVTHDRVWESKSVQPSGGDATAAYYLDSVRGFSSPLAWYLWRYKRTQDKRREVIRRHAGGNGRFRFRTRSRSKSRVDENGPMPLTSLRGSPSFSGGSAGANQGEVRITMGNNDGYFAGPSGEGRTSSGADMDGISKKGKLGFLKITLKQSEPGGALVEHEILEAPLLTPNSAAVSTPSHLSPACPRPPMKTAPNCDPSADFLTPPLILAPNGTIVPKTNVLITIVGSRGDVQPFLAVGMELQKIGHRVRIATHECFRKFVIQEGGLEFFPLAGDPHELMAYMVKNPGLIPSIDSVKSGDIGKKRDVIAAIIHSCWKACTEADPGPPEGTDNLDESERRKVHPILPPFIAECVIANPPSFGHIHVAERLAIPMHIMFTMPWSPTRAFPHPLLNVEYGKKEGNLNLYSYTVCELLTWQGLGDVINKWRRKTLDLPGVPVATGTSLMTNLKVPHTYLWSPNLIPKPDDWGSHIDVTGFCFLDSLSTNYTPDEPLRRFLESGTKPVYIGFGSIVVDDPTALTSIVFAAVKATGVRAIISKGWGGFGGKEEDAPEDVFLIGNCPHDWLFQQVTAVCHHGGAGTTAAGLRLGRPTIVVPFFGDQPFWGSMIAQAGAGPEPIPHKKVNAENLAEALRFAISDGAQNAAEILGARMRQENGALSAALSFQRHLPLHELRCDIEPTRYATFYNPHSDIKMSTVVAQVLISEGRIRKDRMYRYIPKRWVLERAHGNIFTAAVDGARSVAVNIVRGFTSFFLESKKAALVSSTKSWLMAPWEFVKGVAIGLLKLIYYLFKGFGTMAGYLIEGFKNSNSIFDTTELPSESPMVFGFVDGCLKGVSSLFTNCFGAAFDFFWKPIIGTYRSGFVGCLKGLFRGLVSLLTKPLAGALELVYLPLKGLVISIDKYMRASPLEAVDRGDAEKISMEQWQQILDNYDAFLKWRITRVNTQNFERHDNVAAGIRGG